jgi:hypothetical protein
MSDDLVTIKKADLEFVRAYCAGLEGMKTLLTRERDEARERITVLEKELLITNNIYTDEREERGMYEARCAELEKRLAEATKVPVVERVRAEITGITDPQRPTKPADIAIPLSADIVVKIKSAIDEASRCGNYSLTIDNKPVKNIHAIGEHEAYIEARMDYRRVLGGTAAEMGAWWDAHRASFRHDERMVVANGDIVQDMEFES